MQVINPADGSVVTELTEDTATSVAATYQRARAAQPEWAARPIEDRVEVLRRFRALVQYRLDDLAALMTAETGKPITLSRNELNGLLPRLDFFLESTVPTIDDEVVPRRGRRHGGGHLPRAARRGGQHLGLELPLLRRLQRHRAGAAHRQRGAVQALRAGGRHGQQVPEMFWGPGRDAFGLVIGGPPAPLLEQPVDGCSSPGPTPPADASPRRWRSMIRVQLELGGRTRVRGRRRRPEGGG
jgi:hypothetical protein